MKELSHYMQQLLQSHQKYTSIRNFIFHSYDSVAISFQAKIENNWLISESIKGREPVDWKYELENVNFKNEKFTKSLVIDAFTGRRNKKSSFRGSRDDGAAFEYSLRLWKNQMSENILIKSEGSSKYQNKL